MLTNTFLNRIWRRTLLLIGILALGVLGFTIQASHAAPGPLPPDQLFAGAIHADANAFPAVVAQVNGQPISGSELATRLFMISQTTTPDVIKAYTPQRVLQQLIEDQILLEAAPERGISFSDDVVTARIQAMEQLAAKNNDQGALENFAAAARTIGLRPEQYATDARIIKLYRDGFILGAMREALTKDLLEGQRNDPAAQQIAIDRFIAKRHARVEVFLKP